MSEKAEAKRDGAKLTKNSGRGRRKGDATLDNTMIDYKEYASSFSVSLKTWTKVCTDAYTHGLDVEPVIKLVLGTVNRIRIAIISWEYYEELKGYEKQVKGDSVDRTA